MVELKALALADTRERIEIVERERKSEKGRRERKVSDVKDKEMGIFVTNLTFQNCFSFFNKCKSTCNLFIIYLILS